MTGELQNRLTGHSGPVCSLKWNPRGNLLATTSVDNTIVVWLASTGQIQQRFDFGTGTVEMLVSLPSVFLSPLFFFSPLLFPALVVFVCSRSSSLPPPLVRFPAHHDTPTNAAPCLDLDWKNNDCFALCSTDTFCYVCEVGQPLPIRTLRGHGDEVNVIKWDPSGAYLASCSDDCAVKVREVEG